MSLKAFLLAQFALIRLHWSVKKPNFLVTNKLEIIGDAVSWMEIYQGTAFYSPLDHGSSFLRARGHTTLFAAQETVHKPEIRQLVKQ
jgi:hypothetical protein